MRKGMVFFLGMIVGGTLTFFVSLFLLFWFSSSSTSDSAEEEQSPLTLFEQPADIIETASFEVQEVLSDGNAIAKSQYKDLKLYTDPTVLLLADENNPYYDKQIVRIPKGKRAYRVGAYQYEPYYGSSSTLPAVRIMSK